MAKKKTENTKPGVMIYFEILPVLRNLWWWQRLAILEGIIYYARDQKEPKFRGTVRAVWELIKPIVDRDDERYYANLEARKKGGKARGAQISREARSRKAVEQETGEQETVVQQEQHMLPDEKMDGKHMLLLLSDEKNEGQQLLSEAEKGEQQGGSKGVANAANSQSSISNSQSPISNSQSSISNSQSPISNSQSSISNSQSSISNSQSSSSDSRSSNGNRPAFCAPGVEEVRTFVEQERLWVNPVAFVGHYGSRGWQVDGRPVKDWKALARKWNENEKEKKGKRR